MEEETIRQSLAQLTLHEFRALQALRSIGRLFPPELTQHTSCLLYRIVGACGLLAAEESSYRHLG